MPDISIFFLPTPSCLDPEPALRSVLASEFQDWELWVPETIAAASWLQDPRVRSWIWPELSRAIDTGAAFDLHAAMLAGVKQSQGRYLAWIEARHCWSPTKLGTQYAAIEAAPDAAIVWSGVTDAIASIAGAEVDRHPSQACDAQGDPISADLALRLAGVDVLEGWSNALVRRSCCETLPPDGTQVDLPVTPETLTLASVDWFGRLAIGQSAIGQSAIGQSAIGQSAIAIKARDILEIAPLSNRHWNDLQARTLLSDRILARQIDRLQRKTGETLFEDWQAKARSNRQKLLVADAIDQLYAVGQAGKVGTTAAIGRDGSTDDLPDSAGEHDAIAAIEALSAYLHQGLRSLRNNPDRHALAALHDATIRAIALHNPAATSLDIGLRPPNPAPQWRAALAHDPIPNLSIGVPVYNGEATIAATLDSILAQTYVDFELIVIDDGSTDRTADIVARFDDPRLRLLRFENAGLAASRNRAIAAARGRYLSFIDADDLWTPEKLADQYRALENAPRAAVAYSFTDYIDAAGHWLRSGSHITLNGDALGHLLLTDFLENGSNALIRRAACHNVNGFDESLLAAEDWDFFLKLAARYPFVCVPKPQILYRLTDSAMSFDIERQERSCLTVLDRAFESAPEPFRRLKSQSHSNLYQYLAYRALKASPTPDNRQIALRCLRTAIAIMPQAKLHGDRCGDFLAACELYANDDRAALPPTFQPADLFELTDSSPYPLVSVIIPAYNGAKTIVETIASVQAQTLRDWEIILIDDGSTDETAAIVEAIGDPRIQVYRYPNAGQGESRNRGACHATGEFFAFLDADDLWSSDKLERMVKAIGENPKAAVAYSWIDHIDEDGRFMARGCDYTRQGYVYDKLLLSDFIAGGSNLMLWRGAFGMVGGFNPDLPPAEDRDMWLRLAEKFHFVAIEAPLLKYRQVPQSQSANVTRMERSQRRVIEAAFDRAPDNFPFTKLPELLPYYKRQVLANSYKYLTFKQLDAPVNQDSARIALQLFQVVLDNEPTLIQQHRRFIVKLWLRIWLATLLPPPIMARLFQRFRTFHRLHRDLLGYTRMSLRDLLPEDLRQRYAKLTDG